MEKSYLYNKHIRLRNVEPEDLEIIFRIENDPVLWEISSTSVPFSRYILKQYIETTRCDLYADKQLRLMIENTHDRKVVGIVDLADFEPLHNRAAVGIMIREEHRHKGLGKQALELLCQYCSEHLHLKQLYAYTSANNSNSLKLFTSCGFVQSGLLKEWTHTNEGYKDTIFLQKIFH